MSLLEAVEELKQGSQRLVDQMGVQPGIKYIVVFKGFDGVERSTQPFTSKLAAELASGLIMLESRIIEVGA